MCAVPLEEGLNSFFENLKPSQQFLTMTLDLHTLIDLVLNAVKRYYLIDDLDITIESIKYKKESLIIKIKGEDNIHHFKMYLPRNRYESEIHWATIQWTIYTIEQEDCFVRGYIANAFTKMDTYLQSLENVLVNIDQLYDVCEEVEE